MIDELDEALRQLLIRELPVRNGEINLAFDQPKREWSARLSRPTLNIFLYDIRENVKLRQHSPQWPVIGRGEGTAVQKRMPIQLNLYYIITAWANTPDDEHRLLTRALLALYRNPYLEDEDKPANLRGQPGVIEILAAQPDVLQRPADFWGSLDNEIRPGITCIITIALDPYQPITTPVVGEREIGFNNTPDHQTEPGVPTFWAVNGILRGPTPMLRVRATLVERPDLTIPVAQDGAFYIRGLPAGEYTLEVTVDDGESLRHKFTVPSRLYVFDI